ncbi:MAG: HMA2 domain-containing protein [Pseudomonadota bacterium]
MAHVVPGRLRVKLEKLKNNPYQLDRVKELLKIEGVHKIKSTSLTGSMVIEYDNLTTTPEAILTILDKNGYSIDTQRLVKEKKFQENHEKIAGTLGKATISWIAGRILDANGLSFISAFI